MDGSGKELQHVIYTILKRQIEFGVHRFGTSLPTIKEASGFFFVSADTIRLAYVRLKQEGYISLRPSAGGVVRILFSEEEIQRNIQDYFSRRRFALLDLAQAAPPLLSYTQWYCLKHAGPELLDEIEQFCLCRETQPPYRMAQQFLRLYSTLKNDLFLRLVWQMLSFLQAPFLSIPENRCYFDSAAPLLKMIQLCRQQDWHGLWDAVVAMQIQFVSALRRFYDEAIPAADGGDEVQFSWNIYKKTSQICYTLGLDLLRAVRQGVYPTGAFLPAPAKLAAERRISLNTVRRTFALLNKMGAAQSINGVGTKILPPLSGLENCDLSDCVIQNRLLDFVKSLQILALTCRNTAYITVSSLEPAAARECCKQLQEVKRIGQYEIVLYICFELISRLAPFQAVRTVYAELAGQLFWGYPLRHLHGERTSVNLFYLPYLDTFTGCLSRGDAAEFSETLEDLVMTDIRFSLKFLAGAGIADAEFIVIPCREHKPDTNGASAE